MTDEHIPAIVMALAQRVGKEPWQWKEYEDRVVIIFTTGQKMVFERQELSPTTPALAAGASVSQNLPSKLSGGGNPTPAKETKTPAIKSNTTPAKKTAAPPAKKKKPS